MEPGNGFLYSGRSVAFESHSVEGGLFYGRSRKKPMERHYVYYGDGSNFAGVVMLGRMLDFSQTVTYPERHYYGELLVSLVARCHG